MRSFWNGVLRLDKMVVPVGLAPAVSDGSPRFERVHAGRCGRRVSTYLSCAKHGPLNDHQVVRAYDVGGDKVQVSDLELEQLAPRDTNAIAVRCSVPPTAVDPVLVASRYHLLPRAGSVGRGVYEAARMGLALADHLLVCSLVVRGHEWSALVGADGKAMFLWRLRDASDIVPVSIDRPGAGVDVSGSAQVARVVEGMAKQRLPSSALRSPARKRMHELLAGKLASGEVAVKPARRRRATAAA